ncbi:SDR family NAD(P)-dependent oxidoreductase, partial [Escherichia coli]|uniref:SDR family NAD(P)-dependent oxidoreductase n=1 Tax=Escherichia coli TaxID=562 RepID=UPI00300D8F38
MNAFSLHNKTALITGAASGLGLAMAKCMIVSGAKVIIADLNGELAQATAGTLGSQASWIQMDVGDTAAAQEKVDVLISEHGAIDILVNNAGNHCKKPDAPRDKCAHFREINGIAAAFQHLQK